MSSSTDIRAACLRKLQAPRSVAPLGHDVTPRDLQGGRDIPARHQRMIIGEKDAHRDPYLFRAGPGQRSVRLNRVSRESAESIASRPPRAWRVPSMLSSPMLLPAVARSRAAGRRNPRPLVANLRRNSSSVPASVTQTSLACACRAYWVRGLLRDAKARGLDLGGETQGTPSCVKLGLNRRCLPADRGASAARPTDKIIQAARVSGRATRDALARARRRSLQRIRRGESRSPASDGLRPARRNFDRGERCPMPSCSSRAMRAALGFPST